MGDCLCAVAAAAPLTCGVVWWYEWKKKKKKYRLTFFGVVPVKNIVECTLVVVVDVAASRVVGYCDCSRQRLYQFAILHFDGARWPIGDNRRRRHYRPFYYEDFDSSTVKYILLDPNRDSCHHRRFRRRRHWYNDSLHYS